MLVKFRTLALSLKGRHCESPTASIQLLSAFNVFTESKCSHTLRRRLSSSGNKPSHINNNTGFQSKTTIPSFDDDDNDDDGDLFQEEMNVHKLGMAARKERHNSWKFVDKVILDVAGGRGGNGCISYEILTPGKKRPTGGSGGSGGSVYVMVDDSLFSLNFTQFQFNAGDGKHGGGDGMTGRCGENIIVRVPIGTLLSERISDEMEEALMNSPSTISTGNDYPVYEMNNRGDCLLVAEGGIAGIGNKAARGGNIQRGKSVPKTNIPGGPGQKRSIILELKIIADVGLVGFPNAGKSSLLKALSNAKPKVAAYQFTTLQPSVGVVEYSDYIRVTVADIPGIIEGAHENKGLGLDFLRHIERTKMLLFVVDVGCMDGRTPFRDLKKLIKELTYYDAEMLQKPALIFGNKIDVKVKKAHLEPLRRAAESLGVELLLGSAATGEGIGPLAEKLRELVYKTNKGENRD